MPAERQQFSDIDVTQVARNLRHVDDEEMSRTLVGDFRAAVLEEVFARMAEYVDAERAAEADVLVRFEITGAADGGVDTYDVHLHDGTCTTGRAPLGTPVSTLRMNPVDFLRMVLGGVSGLRLYEQGRLTVDGDVETAGALRTLFAIPG